MDSILRISPLIKLVKCSFIFGFLLHIVNSQSPNLQRPPPPQQEEQYDIPLKELEFDFDNQPGIQHEFKLEVHAAREECLWQFLRNGAQLHMSFEVGFGLRIK